MTWRVLVQRSGEGVARPRCIRYELAGVQVPVQIDVVACDASAVASADLTFAMLQREVTRMGGRGTSCGGPAGLGCQAWSESSCRHVLVLVIADVALKPSFEQLTGDWMKRSPFSQVIPALAPGITHQGVFGSGAFPALAKQNASTWGGNPNRLAQEALAASLLDERPAVFISYARRDGIASADAIEDALIADGHRVFLDRHSGTSGRPFPAELREAIASSHLVLVLETPSVMQSAWTRWETAFAQSARVGPVAVHFTGGTSVPHCAARLSLTSSHTVALTDAEVERVVAFVRHHRVALAVERRAYYDALVTLAAQSKGGSVSANGSLLTVRDTTGAERALVLTSGVPGRLRHVHHLSAVGAPLHLLAGDHVHLPPSEADDLKWLAHLAKLDLVGKAAVYRKVRSIL